MNTSVQPVLPARLPLPKAHARLQGRASAVIAGIALIAVAATAPSIWDPSLAELRFVLLLAAATLLIFGTMASYFLTWDQSVEMVGGEIRLCTSRWGRTHHRGIPDDRRGAVSMRETREPTGRPLATASAWWVEVRHPRGASFLIRSTSAAEARSTCLRLSSRLGLSFADPRQRRSR